MDKILTKILICLGTIILISACAGGAVPSMTTSALPPTFLAPTVPVIPPTTLPSNTSPAATLAETPLITSTLPITVQPTGYPDVPTDVPENLLPPVEPLGSLVAFIWNNLGMHCYQADYSQLLILPPYNVFWMQSVARSEEPHIITSGLLARYSLPQETNPVASTNFWDYATAFGWKLDPGIGIKGKGISGTMDASTDHFIAAGVPVMDVNDSGTWDPYPFFVVEVQDTTGKTLATAVNVAPASTEMSCYLCHVANDIQGVFANILKAHDTRSSTSLAQLALDGKPVLCNTCHADPAMGVMDNQNSQATLSGAMHTFHADKLVGTQLPENICLTCHPGPKTQCLRDVMASAGVTCTDCHGGMTDLGDPNRVPWVDLPTCASCHTQALTKPILKSIDNPNQELTASTDTLYQNSKAHGGGGIYCAACHGSPHAIYPTSTARDNEQSIRLQGHAGAIVECEVCHIQKPDESFWHFGGDS